VKKVLVVALNVFRPENRTLKESITLSKNGYLVDIYAVYEKGYLEHEMYDTINVFRLKLLAKRLPKLKILKIFKALEFAIKMVIISRKYEIMHIHNINMLLLSVLIKKTVMRAKKFKIIYDCHEYETETHNLKGLKKRVLKYIEATCIGHVDHTIVVTPSIMDAYKKLYNIDAISVIHNVPFYSNKTDSNIFRNKFHIPEKVKIYIYQGRLSSGRGIEKYIEVFSEIKNLNCCLILMGYGPMEEEVKKVASRSENIYYHEAVALDEIQKYTSSADYGLNITDNTCMSRYYALPNKLFEYVMARVPIIVSNDYERGRFVRDKKLGFVVERNEIKSIKHIIKQSLLYDKREFTEYLNDVANIYHWEKESKKLLEIYKAIDA